MKANLPTPRKHVLCSLLIFGLSIVSYCKTNPLYNNENPFNRNLVSVHSNFLITGEGGLVTANQTICAGTRPANLVLTGYAGDILNWESSEDSSFTSPSTIDNTLATLTGARVGQLSTTTYFRAVVQTANSGIVYSEYATVTTTITSTTWNGTSWSAGEPTQAVSAIIQSNFTSQGTNISACKLTVVNNATVIISSGDTVNIKGSLEVSEGSSVSFESNASLLQSEDSNPNIGDIVIHRNSSPLKRLDYTLWSSPVANQILTDFSPNTVTTRFYTYNTASNLYDVVTAPSATNFNSAKGYLIRTPNNHPTTPTAWTGAFRGVPNNGDYSFSLDDNVLGQRYNLVGNPYPSPIDALAFVSNNNNSLNITGVLYFWRKTNGSLNSSYCVWTELGFTSNGEDGVTNPNGVIQTGQGFFVERLENLSESFVIFTNDMRASNSANQFFKTAATNAIVEKHRIWLNATSATGSFSQTMVGYMNGATVGVDSKIDGKNINQGDIVLTSLIEATPYAVQGRPLPFENADVVPLSFSATTAGNYSIAIDHVDGLFSSGQTVYLRDTLANTVHNLTMAGAYTFASNAGTFTSRFEILYQSLLATPIFTANNVVIYSQSNEFVVNSGNAIMASIKVFDIRGRLIEEKKAINSNQTTINGGLANQVLLVQITSEDGAMVTKKVIR